MDDIKDEYANKRNHTEVLNQDVLSSADRPVRHGPLHVSRVAYYIPVLTNLLINNGDEEAKKLSQEELTAMQVAGLLHDSGRTSDLSGDAAYSDSEIRSVTNCMDFMKKNDVVALEKAFQICHAASAMEHGGPEIYENVIKSADSLDVLRSDDFDFDPNKMALYRQSGDKVKEDLHVIIDAAKERLVQQGDSPKELDSFSQQNKTIQGAFDTDKRSKLETGDIFGNVEKSMNESPLLKNLYNGGQLITLHKTPEIRVGSFVDMIKSQTIDTGLQKF